MRKNIGKNLKNTKGITLIALVITIIVLLILAGVSLSMVFNQDGIFSRAEQATQKYGKAKARETLEIALNDAQIKKYTSGLTETELDNKIAEIEGELLPKEKPNKNLQNVIVEGHIFEIDKSVPKIVDYIGPADSVIITAVITGNDGWVKPGETVSLSGVIKTYSGGTITNSTATVIKGSTTISGFPTAGGDYTISNISENTDIKITASDSNGKKAEKTINIIIKKDNIPPTINNASVSKEGMTIKFSAIVSDNETGLKNLKYTISPTDGISSDNISKNFSSGQEIKITAIPKETDNIDYKITIIATDNSNNSISKDLTININGLTVAEARQIVNENNLQQYMGVKIRDYNPSLAGTWRVFYYDKNGDFGDGEKTLYIIRNNVPNNTGNRLHYISENHTSSDNRKIMKQMNPMWTNAGYSNNNSSGIKCAEYLSDPGVWSGYKGTQAKYAIGCPSLEMFVKAYNVFKENNYNGTTLTVRVKDSYGYNIKVKNGDWSNSTPGGYIENFPKNIFGEYSNICSPWSFINGSTSGVGDYVTGISSQLISLSTHNDEWDYAPIACILH